MARRPQRPAIGEAADFDTRARLLEAALEEFREMGYRAAKIASVCRRANLANGTFYIHFKTKAEIYRTLIRTAAEDLAQRLRVAHQTKTDAKSRDRLEVQVIVNFAEERADLYRLLILERSADDLGHKIFFETLNKQRRDSIRAGIKAGEFRADLDPMLTAIADFGVTTEMVQWWLSNRAVVSKKALIDHLAALRARMFFPPD